MLLNRSEIPADLLEFFEPAECGRCWTCKLVEVFREVRRVLRSDGTCWIECGDSYNSGTGARRKVSETPDTRSQYALDSGAERLNVPGMKVKDLIGAPWLLAFALRADGWYLRSDIIWSRPNPMPESVTDRPTKSHSYVFLLSKSARYFFDQEAVREPWAPAGPTNPRAKYGGIMPSERRGEESRQPKATGEGTYTLGNRRPLYDAGPEPERGPDGRLQTHVKGQDGSLQHRDGERWPNSGRNIRSVWESEQVGRAAHAKHTLTEDYFSSIETEQQAYWLGFLYADAWVGPRHVDLQLSIKDHEHVLRFRDALGSSHQPKPTNNGRTRVVLSSKRLANDLRALGMDTREHMPAMPAELVRHFVRGVFDGDGSAWKYLPAGRTRWRYGAQFMGREPLLLTIRELLALRAKPKFHRGIFRLPIAAADDIARLYDYLYTDASVWLERKRVEFPQAQSVAPDVWKIATEAYSEAHFATFPTKLVEKCILAGTSERGCCPECGAPWVREVERGESTYVERKALGYDKPANVSDEHGGGHGIIHPPGFTHTLTPKPTQTLGWRPSCDCDGEEGMGSDRASPRPVPCVVLDVFGGSGTTALVARKHGRRSILIELSEDYCRLAATRLQQLSLLAEAP